MNYEYPYTFFLTVINEENTPHGIEMKVSPDSHYLEEYVSFEPKLFRLAPRETKNIKVSFDIRKDLPVGAQVLAIVPNVDGTPAAQSFSLDFTIDGEPLSQVELDSFDVHGDDIGKPVYFNMTFTNKGNMLERLMPKFTIYQEETILDVRTYEQPILLLPGETKSIFYFYDPAKLSAGTFRLDVKVDYGTTSIKTSTPLVLHVASDTSNPTLFWRANFTLGMISLLALVVLCVIGYLTLPKIYHNYRKRTLEHRIAFLTERTDELEKTYKYLLSDVMVFVQDANTTLRPQGEQYAIK